MSAAELWRIGRQRVRHIDVSILRSSHPARPGVRIHRRPGLGDENVTVYQGIPVTSPVQTLVDQATRLPRRRLERAVNEADRLDLVNPPTLRRALESHRGEPGVKVLRTLLDRRTFRLTRSDLESIFLSLAVEAGLPVPLTRRWVNGFEVDFYWPDLRFLVETDGLRYHRTPAEQARDRLRDQAHTASGLRHLRFTHEQVKYEPEHVLTTLSATARLLRDDHAEA
jgi:very-short-patch-repair endonuclease